jgi:predicted dehydrogenase
MEEEMTGSDDLKIAIVGMRHGHVGQPGAGTGYLETLKHVRGAKVVAYCEDSDAELLAQAGVHQPGAALYDNVDDLIANEDFDVGWIVLPAAEVPGAGIKLADAGKHFYMEKQFARTSAELLEMVRAVSRNGVKVLPGYPHRFNPVPQDLKRMIDAGVFGRPLDIEMRMVTGQVRPGLREPSSFLYTNADEGGGILHMLGGHYLEVMRFLMGCEVKAVQAMSGRPVGIIEPPLEDVAIAAFEFENGAFGSIHAGYLQRVRSGYDTSLVFRGLDGEADWTPIGDPHLTVKSGVPEWAGAPSKTFQYEVAEVDVPMYGPTEWSLDILRDFAACIREGRQPDVNGDVGLYVLQVIDAVYESARTGQRVEVEYGV